MALDLNDKTSNNNNLTNNNVVTDVTTNLPFVASTHAAGFVGASSQSLSITDASQTGLDLSGNFTIEFWIYPTSTPASNIASDIIQKHDFGANQQGYYIQYFNNAGTPRIEVFISQDATGTVRDSYSINNTFALNTWIHVAITCTIANASATKFEFFFNGVSQGNGSAIIANNCSSINNNTAPLEIGAGINSGVTNNFFNGNIDEVRIWNTVRTVTQINNNKSLELIGNESGLIAYWPFEASIATTTSTTTTTSTSTTTTSTSTTTTSTSTSTTTTSTSTSTTTSSSTSTTTTSTSTTTTTISTSTSTTTTTQTITTSTSSSTSTSTTTTWQYGAEISAKTWN